MEVGYQVDLRRDVDDFESVGMRIKVRASMALFKNLAQMLQQQQFCDLVFELSGSIKFHTHRLVFALWSPVMMNLLSQSSCKVDKVLVKTNLQDAFKQFVHFLYTGTFEGNIIDIDGVLLLASTFQIPLLRSLCEKQLQQAVTVENVIGLFHTSVRYQLPYLEKQCVEHLQEHLPEVAQQSELKDLNPEQFNTFLASQHISQLNPEMKLFLIISWLTEQVNDREHFLVLLLRHIDWSTVAQDFLTEISQTENFFTSHPSSLYLLLQTLHSASISLGPYTDRFEELRREYNEILNNVVTNSVHIGTGRQEIFQPIQLTVISGLAREKEKTLPESKKSGSMNTNNNHKTSKSSRSKEDKASNKSNTSSNVRGSRKRVANALGSKDLKEKESVSKRLEQASSNQKGDKGSTTTSSTTVSRTAIETGSMRRKTLRPRKVVSSSSKISIVSSSSSRTVSTRRTTALRKADREVNNSEIESLPSSSTSAQFESNIQQEDVEEGLGEDHDDPAFVKAEGDDDIDDDDDDEDYVEALKRPRKEPPKTVIGKSKMGRPRKGYERNKFSCPQCEYVTRHSHLLDKHIHQVHESKKVIKCPICDFQCNWTKKLYLHMRTDHYNNSGPPFLCDIQECTYTNDKMNKLVEHRRSHTGDRPFMCDECKMSFRSKSNLYAHLKCHNERRDHECHICLLRFKMKITLDQHLVVHDDARPYLCDLCGFSTKYQAHLKAHARKHSGDVFPCTFPSCKYSTPKKSTLQAHMRSHLGIRHHICETCHKAFIEKSHLVRHMRIHTSEKQHKCMQCDYASHRLDKLREHQQKHEREANRSKGSVTPEIGVDGVANKGTLTSSEPKKKRRKKKEELTQKQQASSKVKDSSDISLGSAQVVESSITSTSMSLSTTPPNLEPSGQGTVRGGSGGTSHASHTSMPSPDFAAGPGRASTMSPTSDPISVITEAGMPFGHVVSNSRNYNNSSGSSSATVVHLPPPKLEKDWNDLEILTRFTVTADGHSLNLPISATSHLSRTTGMSNRGVEVNVGVVGSSNVSVSNSNAGGGNILTEFTDMFRGFEVLPPSSTSIAAATTSDSGSSDHHLQHHHSSDRGGGRLEDGGGTYSFPGPPSHPHSIVFASNEELKTTASSPHAKGMKNSSASSNSVSSDPHPIIMIPNMSSSAISNPSQTYLHHHHPHNHNHPSSQPQQHHHSPHHHHHPPPRSHHHQEHTDDDQHRYHHQRQQHSSSSSSSSSLSHHYQQILLQQQQPGNPSGPGSSSYPHYTGYPY